MFCVISLMYFNSFWGVFHWFPRYIFLFMCLCLAVGIIFAPNAFSFLMITLYGIWPRVFSITHFYMFYFPYFKREMQVRIAFLCLLSRLPSVFNLKKHGTLLSEIWFCYSTCLCLDLLFFFPLFFFYSILILFPVVSPQCGALANLFFFLNCGFIYLHSTWDL